MRADLLHVFAVRSNPLRWKQPDVVARAWIQHMLDSGVQLHLVEVQYGERPFEYDGIPHVDHIGLRAKTWCWSKENALNVGIARVPDARYIATSDSDVFFRRPGWAAETVQALQHYDAVQPWSTAYDLGPNDEHMAVHKSFCHQYLHGEPVAPQAPSWWKFSGGPYEYPHSGYVWAWTRQSLEQRIEDATAITADQLRRLDRMGLTVGPAPSAPGAAVQAYQASAARRPSFGCPSEAH